MVLQINFAKYVVIFIILIVLTILRRLTIMEDGNSSDSVELPLDTQQNMSPDSSGMDLNGHLQIDGEQSGEMDTSGILSVNWSSLYMWNEFLEGIYIIMKNRQLALCSKMFQRQRQWYSPSRSTYKLNKIWFYKSIWKILNWLYVL